MTNRIPKNEYSIDQETRKKISDRCATVTKAINRDFWNGSTDASHSFYVGSYGRHTAISTSDIDILLKLPMVEYNRFDMLKGNGQSRLLQGVKNAITATYSQSDVHADGQVVVINFSDGMKFELLPAFEDTDYWGNGKGTFTYPDTNMGGNWRSTNPKAEIKAMSDKNDSSFGLFFDTCKHLRYIRDNMFPEHHLSGIVIDTFVYHAMGNWQWTQPGGTSAAGGTYESNLLKLYKSSTDYGFTCPKYVVPGSMMTITPSAKDIDTLGKVLSEIAK